MTVTLDGWPTLQAAAVYNIGVAFDVQKVVLAGAAALDRALPGWHEQIDLDQLDLASPCKCILGQLADYLVDLDGDDPNNPLYEVDEEDRFDWVTGRFGWWHVVVSYGFARALGGGFGWGALEAGWHDLLSHRREVTEVRDG